MSTVGYLIRFQMVHVNHRCQLFISSPYLPCIIKQDFVNKNVRRTFFTGIKKIQPAMYFRRKIHTFCASFSFETRGDRHLFQLAEIPGVVQVMPSQTYKLHTTRSWDFLGLNPATPQTLLSATNYGDDVIIGMVDTGKTSSSSAFTEHMQDSETCCQ